MDTFGGAMNRCAVCGATLAPGEAVCHHCGRAQYGETCQHCAQVAPTLVRGGVVICAGCGGTRGPLSAVPLGLVGSVQRVGGMLTGVLAWAVFLGGLAVGGVSGLVVALLASVLHASAWLGLVAGVLLGGIASAAAVGLGAAGRRLRERGGAARDLATEQAIAAMAASRNHVLTTVEVAQNLGLTLPEADRILSGMGERGRAQLEVNGDGLLQYAFSQRASHERTGVRIDPAADAKARVDEEFEAMAARRREGRV